MSISHKPFLENAAAVSVLLIAIVDGEILSWPCCQVNWTCRDCCAPVLLCSWICGFGLWSMMQFEQVRVVGFDHRGITQDV